MTYFSRRQLVQTAALGVIGASSLSACAGGATGMTGPYHMPLETDPHQRTFMQWPVNLDVYGHASLRRTQSAIARIANAIAQFEPVVMLAERTHHASTRRLLSADVLLWDVPTDDLWCRDCGPTFVRAADGSFAVMDFNFNGWGNKQPHANDALVARRVADRLGLPWIDSGVVGEQGGLEHDGAGLVLAHASSWVNPNRNSADAQVIGDRLLAAVGGRKMIWAPGVSGADITDYHIDSLARFVGPGKVLIQLPARLDTNDPWSASAFETLEILHGATDGAGNPIDIVTLPEPVNIRGRGSDFVASYVNYYICNGAVIGAQFGDETADERASAVLAELYPGREIVLLNVDALGASGGGIHCATQQQPRAGS